MIKFYAGHTPNGRKVSVMFEECAPPYEIMKVNLSKGPAVYAGIHRAKSELEDARDQRWHSGDEELEGGGRPADQGLDVRPPLMAPHQHLMAVCGADHGRDVSRWCARLDKC